MQEKPPDEMQGQWNTKGYGKGNFGTPIPPPERVSMQVSATSSSSCSWELAAPIVDTVPPDPIPATQAEIDAWMASLEPITPSNCQPPEIGQTVLWRGFKTGRRGNPSTAFEYFNGTVRDLNFEGNELIVYVT